MTTTRTLLAAALLSAATVTGASAQDGGRFSWNGLYLGVHGGWAKGGWDGALTYRDHSHLGPSPFDPADRSINSSGWLGGGQVGFNQQVGSLVWGLEADGSWVNLNGEDTFTTKDGFVDWKIKTRLDAFGTVRGRLGVTTGPLLMYGTGGLAFGRTSADLVVTQCCLPPDNVTARGSASENHIGWTAGGGLEWMLSPVLSIKAEYLYIDLGKADYQLAGTNYITGGPHSTDSFPADLDFHVIRAGLNWRFNTP